MADKDILIVTNYFPPEKGAASNRMFSLASELSKNGYNVQVVCPFPNYPNGEIFDDFNGKFYEKLIENKLITHRLWVWPSKSKNKFIRLISMMSFSFSLMLFFFLKTTPKKVIVQYSPVFVGFTAVFWSWVYRKKIILNVSDIWPLAGLEMGLLSKGFYYSLLERMEDFCYRKSTIVLGQSQEILSHIKRLGVDKPSLLYRNIPQFNVPISTEKKISSEITLVYAGLLGIAQGLYEICTRIKLPPHVILHIYGAGPEAIAIRSVTNDQIRYHGEIDRESLHKELQQYDIAFIPLINRIYGSVPSKIFEFSMLGLPLLYFAGGEGEDIVKKNNLGWNVSVTDIDELQQFLNSLTIDKLKGFPKRQVQANAIQAFNFNEQFANLLNIIESC